MEPGEGAEIYIGNLEPRMQRPGVGLGVLRALGLRV